MIDLYTAKTPNGRKISIMLEECGLPYRVNMVDIGRGEQFQPDFIRINPNAKIPAIVDHDSRGQPVPVFESGSILIYLAEKTGRFLPVSPIPRSACLSWLFWQVGNVGPMFGQANHFATVAGERLAYPTERFGAEAARLVRLMDQHLETSEFLAGDYSIADMASFPWLSVALSSICQARPQIAGEGHNVRRWLSDIASRPAVVRGMAVGRALEPAEARNTKLAPTMSDGAA
ncbi:MAG: glutathione S-transferase N-terminal domain-containing protein [Phenylobacterium sp.]|uniref:glutathione S-transferase N-terminal domain-containing protein n=1 Tax=Phenylobacterium sp. TaxID=1871053 RepID=UPI0027348714|nr:glutathione S-transferase N-terminal domain-containing protein [Phenylobacterium sp.]MDP3749623.1 glutathione S-transferase N-terminal domain-containing protein [Phenylobacterium sp.]